MSIATIDNKGGGVKLVDINPNKYVYPSDQKYMVYASQNDEEMTSLPIYGYKKVAFFGYSGTSMNWKFKYTDGTYSTQDTITFSSDGWINYIDIPNNAELFCFHNTTSGRPNFFYSLLA